MIDAIGRPLAVIIAELKIMNLDYLVDYTYPPRRTFPLLEDELYVLRQHVGEDEIIRLIAGPKMGKEV